MFEHKTETYLLLLLIPAIMVLVHYKQNKALKKIDSTFSLRRFAWGRSLQLLAVLLIYTAVIIVYDTHLRQTRFDLARLESSQMQVDDILAAINNPPPVELAEPKGNIQTKSSDPISEMYDSSALNSDKQSKLDAIKSRYEEILVTHFFLRKCEVAQIADYHIIMSALAVEMASVNAPGRLQYDILTAARGSYREMYAKTSCEPANLSSLRESYALYISSISKNVVTP
jgi:hypothetical protein